MKPEQRNGISKEALGVKGFNALDLKITVVDVEFVHQPSFEFVGKDYEILKDMDGLLLCRLNPTNNYFFGSKKSISHVDRTGEVFVDRLCCVMRIDLDYFKEIRISKSLSNYKELLDIFEEVVNGRDNC